MANCFEKVGFKGFIVNIGYLGWRILDFGRIAVWILVSLSENFWIYPPKVSKGWDSTLAHLPYYKLRLQFLEYLDANNIDFKDVDTFFPSYHSAAVIDLNNAQRTFDNYTIGNGSKYVFYSNIFNIDDAVFYDIMNHYKSAQRFENNGVYVILFNKN